MTDALLLPAEIRHNMGKGPARSLRRQGRVPAIIYGAGKSPLPISLEEKEITRLYRKKHFISTVINLDVEGKQIAVLPKIIDLHPIHDVVRHLDFIFLEDTIQKVQVPIVFEGKEKSLGVKRGGFFNTIKRTIQLLCPVNEIPRSINVDVSNFIIGQSLKLSDLPLPQGCKSTSKKDFIIASITGKGGKADATEEAVAQASTPTTAESATKAKAPATAKK